MESQPSSSLRESQLCRHFEFPEIQLATENFDESLVIGKGGFGNVYKGNVINGSGRVVAAIKRLDSMSTQGADEFWAEVKTLSMLRHSNLVSLIGYCNHGKEMILVYEYMPNGTLYDHLHKLGTPLSWVQRLKICIGSGQGLHYLHTGTGIDSGVIHRDVKSSNIMLHESWSAKISDFGLSKIGPTNQPSTYVNTHVKGSFGYFDPNYFATGRLTRKSDVYAFGVVLMEVLCRKRAVDGSLDWGLVTWAQDSIKEGNLKNIIDSGIMGEISPKCLKQFVGIAERCLHSHPKQRPTMSEVVVCLESILISQEKINSSSQAAGKTIFGRMLMFPFTSVAENSAHGDAKLSKGNSKTVKNTLGADNKTLMGEKEPSGENRTQSLKECVDRLKSGNNVSFSRESSSPKEGQYGQIAAHKFTFLELAAATNNFSPDCFLGEGGFGSVYRGRLQSSGQIVAVKQLDRNGLQGNREFLVEVLMLSLLHHPNIVNLIGHCADGDQRLLVYEFMPLGSLEDHLHDLPPDREALDWNTRMKIAVGAARGLEFLHDKASPPVIYRNFKSSNILLGEGFQPKLSDFGLAKLGPTGDKSHVSTRVMGTYGYCAPEYAMTGQLTVKSDVYSFGVVFLELITGRKAIDSAAPQGQQNLVTWRLPGPHNLADWARPFLGRREQLTDIMDPRLEHNYPREGAFECSKLASRCLAKQPKDRPSSEEVLQSLEQL